MWSAEPMPLLKCMYNWGKARGVSHEQTAYTPGRCGRLSKSSLLARVEGAGGYPRADCLHVWKRCGPRGTECRGQARYNPFNHGLPSTPRSC